MAHDPSASVLTTDSGFDLVHERTFAASPDEVWRQLTDSSRTNEWIGPWTGDAIAGATILVTWRFEAGTPVSPVQIDACEAPSHLALTVVDDEASWNIDFAVSALDDGSRLQLVHHLDRADGIGEIGPGWEYYLDMFASALAHAPLPDFGDYYPAQKEYFEQLIRG